MVLLKQIFEQAKSKQNLIKQLKMELSDDFEEFRDQEDPLATILDTPSNTVQELEQELVDLVGEKEFKHIMDTEIMPFIKSLT